MDLKKQTVYDVLKELGACYKHRRKYQKFGKDWKAAYEYLYRTLKKELDNSYFHEQTWWIEDFLDIEVIKNRSLNKDFTFEALMTALEKALEKKQKEKQFQAELQKLLEKYEISIDDYDGELYNKKPTKTEAQKLSFR